MFNTDKAEIENLFNVKWRFWTEELEFILFVELRKNIGKINISLRLRQDKNYFKETSCVYIILETRNPLFI